MFSGPGGNAILAGLALYGFIGVSALLWWGIGLPGGHKGPLELLYLFMGGCGVLGAAMIAQGVGKNKQMKRLEQLTHAPKGQSRKYME